MLLIVLLDACIVPNACILYVCVALEEGAALKAGREEQQQQQMQEPDNELARVLVLHKEPREV